MPKNILSLNLILIWGCIEWKLIFILCSVSFPDVKEILSRPGLCTDAEFCSSFQNVNWNRFFPWYFLPSFEWMMVQTERGWMACSVCWSGVSEVCGVEFGCSIRCRWATVGVKRTCTTRKWLLWCSWYQKPKPSVNGLVFCDLVPEFVQRPPWCIQTMKVGQGLLFSGSKTFYNIAAPRWCQNAALSASCYMIGG